MPNKSDDNEDGNNPLNELRELLEEFSTEIESDKRQNIFKMAEFLLALEVRTEPCQIEMVNGKKELGLVVPYNQFSNLRKALLNSAI